MPSLMSFLVTSSVDPKKFASFVETFIFFASGIIGSISGNNDVATLVGRRRTRRAIAFTLSLFSHGHLKYMEKVYCGGIRMDVPS